MMRLMVMFDLPVETSKQRREYRKFHKRLIQEGFLIIQYSVYARVCVSRQSANFMEQRIKGFLPDEGLVQTFMMTEKQYNDMHFLRGKNVHYVRNTSKRTIVL